MNAITVAPAIALKRPADHLPEQPNVVVDRSTDAAPVKSEAVWSNADAPKPAYPAAAKLPTQVGPKGLRFDFNDGARIVCPHGEQPWKARIRDIDTGNVLFETESAGGYVNSSKRYDIRFGIEISQQGESVLDHEYAAKDRAVLTQFPVGTLGDTVGWFPYAVKFKDTHGCKPYRVLNFHACNSCGNDPRLRFDHKDFLWCPRHASSQRQFECTRLITGDHVKQVIQRIPRFPVGAKA
ncbi:hypothetical protein ACVILK_001593 [Bradyrhizobium embrapense]